MLDNLDQVEDINEYVLSAIDLDNAPKIDQKTLDDYYAFFTGKEVDMLPYVYVEPSNAYNNLVHAPEYYLFRDEVNTIASNKEVLKKYLKDVTDIIEIGPGCDYTVENKTVPILNCAANLKRYHAIDYSENYLKEACRSVEKRKKDIEIRGVKADLMNGKINLNIASEGKRCVLFLGSTLGNFTEKQQYYAIDQIGSILLPNDKFILTLDTNLDCKTNMKAYSNDYTYNFIILIFKYFAKLCPEFNKYINSFNMLFEWNNLENQVKLGFIAAQDIFLNCKFFSPVYIPKGKFLYASSSQKFIPQKILTMLKNKFEIIETMNYSNKMITLICKKL